MAERSVVEWTGVDPRVVRMLEALQRFGDHGPGAAGSVLEEERIALAVFLEEYDQASIAVPFSQHIWLMLLDHAQHWATSRATNRPREMDTSVCIRRAVGEFAVQSGVALPASVRLGDHCYTVASERDVTGPTFVA